MLVKTRSVKSGRYQPHSHRDELIVTEHGFPGIPNFYKIIFFPDPDCSVDLSGINMNF